MPKDSKPKWTFDGLYVWDNSIVGTATKAPNGYYYAHGCEDDWEDVRLGAFDSERDARRAVERWVKENCS